jgi:YidC/Oxa1 family membrane protein insertase
MNISRFLLIASFAWLSSIAAVYLLKRFVLPQPKTEQEQAVVITPHRSIDFDCEPKNIPAQRTVIETAVANWTFSTHGASLEQLLIKRDVDGDVSYISIMPKITEHDREKRAFLAVLDEKTPYYYSLKNVQEDDQKAVITYTAHTPQADIEKAFTVDKNLLKLDLVLKVTPLKENPISVRLFYPAPASNELGSDDVIQAVVRDPKGSVKKIQRSSISDDAVWQPALFGAEDKFFANVLYHDTNSFAQRAFYHLAEKRELYAIVQGPAITSAAQWHLSFYVGPKEEKALSAVDKQLEDLLDYSGILAPVAKILYKILQWLNSYVHNFGWAIILLTLLINLILLPFNIRSMASVKKTTEFQKKMDYLKHRYKNDPETFKREQTELLAKHGIPMIGGCLPKLLQLPIFFALGRVLSSSYQLHHAPFIGWIHDLSAADPYYILPIMIVLLWLVQSTTVDIKQRFVMIAVALIMGTAATGFSAGLCLYMVVSLLLNFLQTFLAKFFKWA